MSKTRLVIFDLDGTLLDTIGDLAASCNHTLEQFGHPTHPTDAYRMFVGNGIAKLVERALPEKCRTAEYVERVRLAFVEYYRAHIADFTRPYEGVPALLERLAEQGVQLAVASNKFHEGTVALIDHFFGCERFVAVYGQRAGVPIKPDPTVVRQIIAEAGVVREEVLYVGDSGVDMQTAVAADVRSVG
ncbi:MAG: HAD-IA family hydrolase, partial [Rikenellaceae bacterium]|nr:HAD-IA family hydrolase [Rikenellaceae bacterium]